MTSPLVIRESKRGRPHLSSARVHDSLPAPEEISENSKNISLDQLVLSSDARERLYRLSQMFVMRETVLRGFASAVNIHNRSHSSLSLPNILIIGPPGTGKSVAATTLAHSSGLPYLSLCGGDILGASPTLSSPTAAPASVHSGGPGGLLRDVLDSAAVANNQKGYLVILDEADALIATAKKPNCPLAENENREVPESNEEVIADCLHILLHRLRINSPSLGTIITTNMEIHMIDAAFLDRCVPTLTSLLTISLEWITLSISTFPMHFTV